MLSNKIQEALNAQLKHEFFSAYLYLSMAAWCESNNFDGMANWMKIQFQEEQAHAMKFFDYITERGGRVELQQISAPLNEWDCPVALFEATLDHEQKVTRLINDLVCLAREERDNATELFLGWFINEQVEEEASVDKVLGQLKIAKDSPQALLMIDRELGSRVFVPPTPA